MSLILFKNTLFSYSISTNSNNCEHCHQEEWLYGYLVGNLTKTPQLKIIRIDEKLNAFRFGFASKDEKELEEIVDTLRIIFESLTVKWLNL